MRVRGASQLRAVRVRAVLWLHQAVGGARPTRIPSGRLPGLAAHDGGIAEWRAGGHRRFSACARHWRRGLRVQL